MKGKLTKFIYGGKEYSTWSLDELLKKKSIPREEIQIIEQPVETEEMNGIPKHHFINRKTGCTITSIYPELDGLKDIIDINEWEKID